MYAFGGVVPHTAPGKNLQKNHSHITLQKTQTTHSSFLCLEHCSSTSCYVVLSRCHEHSTGICLKNKNTNTEKFRLTIIPMRTLNPIKHVAASHSVQPITLQRRRQGWGGGGGGGGRGGGFSPPPDFCS